MAKYYSAFIRAFSVFRGKKLFGIHSCIPRHCGRGKRGKRIRLKPNANYLIRPINRTAMNAVAKMLSLYSVFSVAINYSAFIRAFPDTAVGAGVAKELG